MEYKKLNIAAIEKALGEIFFNRPTVDRRVTLYTNSYGADMHEETVVKYISGKSRIYIGFKVPRWLRKAKINIIKSKYTKRYYKLI